MDQDLDILVQMNQDLDIFVQMVQDLDISVEMDQDLDISVQMKEGDTLDSQSKARQILRHPGKAGSPFVQILFTQYFLKSNILSKFCYYLPICIFLSYSFFTRNINLFQK